MSVADLESFRMLVLDTPEIQLQLHEIHDIDAFMEALIRAAVERGYNFTREEANAALRAGKVSWLQRWAWW